MPQISVLMAVYNEKPEYLAQSITSILRQTMEDFVFVIINDGSEFGTTEQLKKYAAQDSRIRLLHNETNRGLTYSLNRGIKAIQSPYIARMDSNDVAEADRLDKQLRFLRENDLDFVGSNCTYIDEKGWEIGTKNRRMPRDLKRRLLWGNFFTHSTFFGKKEVFDELYDEDFRRAQDYDFLLRIAAKDHYKIGYQKDSLLKYRVEYDGISMRRAKEQERAVLRIKWRAWRRYGYPFGRTMLSLGYGLTSYLFPRWMKDWVLEKFAPKPEGERERVLGVFLTTGISVKKWNDLGLLAREKLIYEQFLKNGTFDRIIWFDYGTHDRELQSKVAEGITIVPKPRLFMGRPGSLLYSFVLPIIRWKAMRQCTHFKTNQIFGSWAAAFSKWVHRKMLIVRTGFTESRNDKIAGKRWAYRVHSVMEKFAYRFADRAIVTTESQRDYLAERHPKLKIDVIHNYIDTAQFRRADQGGALDIVYVGRLSEEKNLFNLIEAVAQTDFTLDIYGKGELKNELEQKISALGASETIRLMGTVDNAELPGILNQYKLYVLPSFYEGLPKTLLEAMACGVACLGTDVAGIREVIENGVNGLLVKSDPESIRQGIRALALNSTLRTHLGLNARKTIEASFGLEKIAEREGEIYGIL